MIANKKEFGLGFGLMVGFWALFVLFMTPIFNGQNLLDYMDSLYNSISKASAYYVPKATEKANTVAGKTATTSIKVTDEAQAKRMTALLQTASATVEPDGKNLKVTGDLGQILKAMIADADLMFSNKGAEVSQKYGGADPKQALFDWYTIGKTYQKSLEKENDMKSYNVVYSVQTKAVEPAFNYYGIEAKKITENVGTVVISLAGYVVYTLWFGFAILFMFEGWGLKLEH